MEAVETAKQVKQRDFSALAKKYARDVTSGKIVAGKYLRKSCKRFLDDLERKDFQYKFDKELANRACRFIELLPHVKGSKARKTIKLEPWQAFFIANIFGWVDKKTRFRRFRKAQLWVGRGNGKSTISSGVALYMLVADGELGAEVYSAATTRDQSRIVFGDAQAMLRSRSELIDKFGLTVEQGSIFRSDTNSSFRPLSSEYGTLDGRNSHCVVLDELHAHPTRGVFDVMETSMGKRDQPLMLIISTGGNDSAGIGWEMLGYAKSVLDGFAKDENHFAVVYEADPDDAIDSEEAWAKANPNLDISVPRSFLKELVLKAQKLPSARAAFETRHLNRFVNTSESWLDMNAWDECAVPGLSIADFAGKRCLIGLDVATRSDICAVALIFPDSNGVKTSMFTRNYLPEKAVSDGRNASYPGWALEGHIITTPGDVIDFDRIREDILEDMQNFNVEAIVIDPLFNAQQLSNELMEDGANVIEVKMTTGNINNPMKELEAMVQARKVQHPGCPATRWQMANVQTKTNALDLVRPFKENRGRKIDAAVALMLALQPLTAASEKPQVWSGGLRSL